MYHPIVPERSSTRLDIEANIAVSRAYLHRACLALGEATDDDELHLARTFVRSALGEVNYWTYRKESDDA